MKLRLTTLLLLADDHQAVALVKCANEFRIWVGGVYHMPDCLKSKRQSGEGPYIDVKG